jgi:hypothetical protein
MPIGERLFRIVWLGPVGRAFIRLSSRGVARRTIGGTLPGATPPPSSKSNGASNGARAINRVTPTSSPDRVTALEARIVALERWRDGSQS